MILSVSMRLPLLAVATAVALGLELFTVRLVGFKLDFDVVYAAPWPLFIAADDFGRMAVLGLCYVTFFIPFLCCVLEVWVPLKLF